MQPVEAEACLQAGDIADKGIGARQPGICRETEALRDVTSQVPRRAADGDGRGHGEWPPACRSRESPGQIARAQRAWDWSQRGLPVPHRLQPVIDEPGPGLGPERCCNRGELLRVPAIIGIEEAENGAAARTDTFVERCRLAAIAAQDQADLAVEPAEDITRFVGRSIVDNDDLAVGLGLGERRGHRLADEPAIVEIVDDDAEGRPCHHPVPLPKETSRISPARSSVLIPADIAVSCPSTVR